LLLLDELRIFIHISFPNVLLESDEPFREGGETIPCGRGWRKVDLGATEAPYIKTAGTKFHRLKYDIGRRGRGIEEISKLLEGAGKHPLKAVIHCREKGGVNDLPSPRPEAGLESVAVDDGAHPGGSVAERGGDVALASLGVRNDEVDDCVVGVGNAIDLHRCGSAFPPKAFPAGLGDLSRRRYRFQHIVIYVQHQAAFHAKALHSRVV
jgi:hypothetical protein